MLQRMRPNFVVKLPRGFYLKKEIREWTRDWIDLEYISPYADASHLDQVSPEMEKRMIGVFHELLSLSLFKRIPVPIPGKFTEDYRFSNSFSSAFSRHSGIFYMSRKGEIEMAVLWEAYNDGLIDRDHLLEMKDKFVELLEKRWRERAERDRSKTAWVEEEMKMQAMTNADMD